MQSVELNNVSYLSLISSRKACLTFFSFLFSLEKDLTIKSIFLLYVFRSFDTMFLFLFDVQIIIGFPTIMGRNSDPKALSAHKMLCDGSRRVFYGFRSAWDMFVSPIKRIACVIYRLERHSQAALTRLAFVKKN